MKGRRNPFVAREGRPFLAAGVLAAAFSWYLAGPLPALLPLAVSVALYALFRDPPRQVPSAPLAVVSPVDGTVVDVAVSDDSILGGEAHKITIRVDAVGTYTARSPIEGTIMDFRDQAQRMKLPDDAAGLWVRTDEGDDVVLRFRGHRLGLVPRAFGRYGERVGQGQRCAYLRLTRVAEVQMPINSQVRVVHGQRLTAGSDILGQLPHH
ncbi:MAG: phosphatidylserine decarboxylase [Woeseiaceae bacterium]